jgi:pyridinium-3,5-biscarboxylic acid mononucleotide sulfurtransferase
LKNGLPRIYLITLRKLKLNRYEELKKHLVDYKKVIVSFSGGIDSYFVLKAAIDSLGKTNVLAVTGDSPSLKQSEKSETKVLASKIGASHETIYTYEINDPNYYNNTQNRCFFCKDELYSKLVELAHHLKIKYILDGTNFDDMSDYRPGYKASKNYHIVSPLVDLKFRKNEIREIAKHLNLEIWDKPSSPCLSSRIPYGQKVSIEKLFMIEKAEDYLTNLGLKEFRVRHFEINDGMNIKFAKIDINKNEFDKILDSATMNEINSNLKSLGYQFVTIDLGGLNSGSMNINVNKDEIEK